ncbi:MAG TPA: hypothetical protein VFL83_17625 [Anaeromyxobacter sp.]|nr:hypothetical protein [Anaeromyxobacter sp.]
MRPPAKALARAALAAAALLAAVPAGAAQRGATSTPRAAPAATSPRTPPAAAPAPAAPARAPASVPLPPPPETAAAASAPRRDLRIGALLGLSTPGGNGGDASLLLQVDAALAWRRTPGGVALAWALPVRTVFLQSDEVSGLESGGFSVEVTPTLRASVPVRPTLALRTEAGLGFVARWTWAEADITYVGRATETDQAFTALARVGFALDWALRPGVTLAFEPLSFGYDLDGNADWNFAAGLGFRL